MKFVTHQFTANVAKRQTLEGTEYAVAPVVAVIAGMLNGELLPADSIAASVEAWEGVPLTVGHPQINGEYVMFNDAGPSVQVGMLRNVRMVGEKLVGEAWINTSLASVADIIARIDNDDIIEVSTGYFADTVLNEDGVYVQSNIEPDHLALLPNEVGACSVSDGCGTPRSNQTQENTMTVKAKTDVTAGVTPVTSEEDGATTAPVTNTETQSAPQDPAPVAVTAEIEGLEEIREFAAMLQEAGGIDSLRSLLSGLKANADAQRAEAIAVITANSELEASDLEGMTLTALTKLAGGLGKVQATEVDYFGLTPARVNVATSEWEDYEPAAVK